MITEEIIQIRMVRFDPRGREHSSKIPPAMEPGKSLAADIIPIVRGHFRYR